MAAIRHLSPELEPRRVEDRLDALRRRGLVEPGETRFAGELALRFAHGLVCDVAYQGLLKQERAELHERFASWLRLAAGDRASEHDEILGYHLERAFRYREALGPVDPRLAGEAAQRLGSAGRRALARGDMPAAVNLLERAISLLPEDDPTRSDLSLKLGIALAETGELQRADVMLTERLHAERRGRHYLVYLDDTGRRQIFDLDAAGSPVTIGRRAENDISLPWDGEVSRHHAQLEWRRDHWVLSDDANSHNGSFVNGLRVTRHPLDGGDVLRLGNTVIRYRAPGATTDGEPPDESRITTTRALPGQSGPT